MYSNFGLVLMVNHACNLRCTYCYTGTKFSRAMPFEIAARCVDRACNSLDSGGILELSFFGGEPLLEAGLIQRVMTHAQKHCAERGRGVEFSLTTNGTIDTPQAWEILLNPAVDLTVSFDGLPEIHNRHRVDIDGAPTSARVVASIQRLVTSGKSFQVIAVVRPDTVAALPAGLRYLRELGVDLVVPSLDLWTRWSDDDLKGLERALSESAEVWLEGLPQFGVSWFNEKAVELSGVPLSDNARCGFGAGEIAVAPSGHLYPCERLIGVDEPTNPMRLPGHALTGADFCFGQRCNTASTCGLSCSCSNYVRSGNITTTDPLLDVLDRVCLRETRRVLTSLQTDVPNHT